MKTIQKCWPCSETCSKSVYRAMEMTWKRKMLYWIRAPEKRPLPKYTSAHMTQEYEFPLPRFVARVFAKMLVQPKHSYVPNSEFICAYRMLHWFHELRNMLCQIFNHDYSPNNLGNHSTLKIVCFQYCSCCKRASITDPTDCIRKIQISKSVLNPIKIFKHAHNRKPRGSETNLQEALLLWKQLVQKSWR
jgi:hypothetical protein